MMPNVTRGNEMTGLMVYLAGEGRHNEHQEQHLVTGDSAIVTMYGFDQLDKATALNIAHDLDISLMTSMSRGYGSGST
jgi:hypothetical protein